MSKNIIPLLDDAGEQFYPQTHEKAVIDSNGVDLQTKLANISAPGVDSEDIVYNASNELQFANRSYDSLNPNEKGYVILRPNDTFANQVTTVSTIYEIRYAFDLGGASFTMPSGCVLRFIGGTILNGTLVLSSTLLEGDVKILCDMSGTMANRTLYSSWNDSVSLSVANAKALGSGICVDMSATLSAPLSFFGMKEVEIRGTITNSETNYIEIGYSSSQAEPTSVDIWNASYIKLTGAKAMIATIRHCDYFVLEANNAVSGKGSIAYCTFTLGYVKNFAIIGRGTGWINENTFIKGRFITSFTIQGDEYPHNNNVFYNPTLEGDNLTISLSKCSYNTFRDVRLEGDVSFVFDDSATNNRFYRSWLPNASSLMRKYYGLASKNRNGVYFEESMFARAYTISQSTYIGNRNLDKVSLCDNNKKIRYEEAGAHARLNVQPKTDFGITFMTDGDAMSRMRVYFYDTADINITDTLTSYIESIGTFSKVDSDPVYYKLDRDDAYDYLSIRVDGINAYLLTAYGVDGNENPNKQLGRVMVEFRSNNVRKIFSYIDLRVVCPANAKDNCAVALELPFASSENTSSAKPTIQSTISGTSVPHSILDGESCYVEASNSIYKRVGSAIQLVGKMSLTATSLPENGMLPDVFYNLGTLSGDTTFSLATPSDNTVLNHYYFCFDTPSPAPTITWPTGLTWVGGSTLLVEASKHYEVSIINNVAAYLEA